MTKQIIINGESCDIDEQTSIGIDIQGFDIKNPAKNKVNVSNEFSLPKTAKNLRIIGWLGNVHNISTSIYTYKTITYMVSGKVLIDGKVNIKSISDRIYCACVQKDSVFDDMKKMKWYGKDLGTDSFMIQFFGWLVTEKSLPWLDSRQTEASINDFIQPYTESTTGLHISLYFGNLLDNTDIDLTGIVKEGISDETDPGDMLRKDIILSHAGKTGGHVSCFLPLIFEFIEDYFNVDLGATKTGITGNIFEDAFFKQNHIVLKSFYPTYINNSGTFEYFFALCSEIFPGSAYECSDLTIYDFFIAVCQRFCVVIDRIKENEYLLRKLDDLHETNMLNWSGRYTETPEFMPSIEGYKQNNLIKFKEKYDGASEDIASINIECKNETLELTSDLMTINSYIPNIVKDGSENPILLNNSENSNKNWLFLVDNGYIFDCYYHIYISNSESKTGYNGLIGIMPLSSISGVNDEYDVLKSMAEYPVSYNIKRYLNIMDIVNIENFQHVFIKELGGSFFINKISGYNPESKQPHQIELIKTGMAIDLHVFDQIFTKTFA